MLTICNRSVMVGIRRGRSYLRRSGCSRAFGAARPGRGSLACLLQREADEDQSAQTGQRRPPARVVESCGRWCCGLPRRCAVSLRPRSNCRASTSQTSMSPRIEISNASGRARHRLQAGPAQGCTRGSRSGEPARSQSERCAAVALSAAYRRVPAARRPPLGELRHGSDRQVRGGGIDIADVSSGSAAPVRDFQMQPFGRELAAVVGRHSRTTAVSNSDLPDGLGEGQVPKWTGRSPSRPPRAPLGRSRRNRPTGLRSSPFDR